MKKPFKKCETYYHKCAVETLSSWVNGIIEKEFILDGSILFVPDVVVYENGIIQKAYEVVHTNPIGGRKLGLIQYYCYRTMTELTVHEVSVDFILSQKEKPEVIESIETYIIETLN